MMMDGVGDDVDGVVDDVDDVVDDVWWMMVLWMM